MGKGLPRIHRVSWARGFPGAEAPRRRRSLLPQALALLLAWAISPPAQAFKGREHDTLSTVGLWLALEAEKDPLFTSGIERLFLQCTGEDLKKSKEPDRDKGAEACLPFGQITVAVDRVFRPEGLVPAAEKTYSEPPEAVSADFAKRCKRSLISDKVELFLAAKPSAVERLRFVAERIRKKQGDFLNFLLAVHRNSSHFEACAAMAYQRFHDLALYLAKTKRPEDAEHGWIDPLIAEAVALHFLQDSFAPGHLQTPRSASTDLISRGLHNRGNKDGAMAYLRRDRDLENLLSLLRKNIQKEPSDRPHWADLSTLLPNEAEALPLFPEPTSDAERAGAEIEFFGDGLLQGRPAVALTLLSALSIQEVLRAGRGEKEQPHLRIDFIPWSAEVQKGTSDDLSKQTLHRPGFDLRRGPRPTREAVAEPGLAGFFPREQGEDGRDRFSMRLANFEVAAGLLVGDSDQENGTRVEVTLPFGGPSDDDIRRRKDGKLADCKTGEEDEKGKVSSPCTFQSAGNRIALGVVVSWSLQFDRWEHYDAVGFMVRGLYPWRVKNLGWDLALAGEVGQKWYESPVRSTSRFVWGGRASLGLGIVFADLGFERGSRLLPNGEQQRNTSYLLGVRVQLPF